jgi:ABC-type transporter Mla subunit MlaD
VQRASPLALVARLSHSSGVSCRAPWFNGSVFRKTRAIVERLDAGTEALRRQTAQLERQGSSLERQAAQLDANTEAIRRLTEESAASFGRQRAILDQQVTVLVALKQSIDDHRDESRAHTQALLRMLDRLDGPEPGPATG